ncbi:hypothetical protein [Streptomyces collinus]|uniref:hypothetical protein n=1 Tax=Streptomyces collinus TaxID=42684 RepID=UPI0029438CDC|nr:hypothetical protein [Streptomyces collinus]
MAATVWPDADVPRTEVHFLETADATGVRFTELPLTRDRVWRALERRSRTPRRPVSP